VNDINPEEIENIEIVKGPSADDTVWNRGRKWRHRHHDEEGTGRRAKVELLDGTGQSPRQKQIPRACTRCCGKTPGTTAQRKCLLKELSVSASATGATCILDSATSVNVFH
jgi:hypothetical protein